MANVIEIKLAADCRLRAISPEQISLCDGDEKHPVDIIVIADGESNMLSPLEAFVGRQIEEVSLLVKVAA